MCRKLAKVQKCAAKRNQFNSSRYNPGKVLVTKRMSQIVLLSLSLSLYYDQPTRKQVSFIKGYLTGYGLFGLQLSTFTLHYRDTCYSMIGQKQNTADDSLVYLKPQVLGEQCQYTGK